ncbi:MAG TPA: zinc ribbon domain-containing protein [Chitinispirillaceae bacterium]|nr:zinc ribbon domain-containing protein [Chitinispirillaceae bacterium]
MPIFEYRCPKCQNVFEELVTGDRNVSIACPACGFKDTEKMMSAIGGISMGKSSCNSGLCQSQCSNASSCSSGGCCPHAG